MPMTLEQLTKDLAPSLVEVADRIAGDAEIPLAELLDNSVHRPEVVRARHRLRAVVAATLGFGAPGGVNESELARRLRCDRSTLRVSLASYERSLSSCPTP